MKKFDVKKINWKKTAIIAALILVAAWGLSEVFRLHASIVTVKYVADMETYQSDPNGGYTSAISTRDKKEIRQWIRLYEKIVRDGEKSEKRVLSEAFPSYNIAFRLNNRIVQTLVVTPDRVGVFNFLTGSYVLEFEDGNPYYEIVAQRVAEHESEISVKTEEPETEEEVSQEKTEDVILKFELNDTFRELLGRINAEHQSVTLFDGEYSQYLVWHEDPELDPSQYQVYFYDTPSGVPTTNITLTLEQVTSEMELFYQLLRTEYGSYTYFGGDEVFRPAIDAVIADCAAMETITLVNWVKSMLEHMSFIEDGHFSIMGMTLGQYAVPFFFRNITFYKTDEGYVTEDGRLVTSVDGFEDLDELFKLSLTAEGELVYYPVVLESFSLQQLKRSVKCSTTVLTVQFADGTTAGLFSDPYSLGEYAEYPVDASVKNGIPYVTMNQFIGINGGHEFNDTAFRYRDSDILIMDLRANGGGFLNMATQWFTDYTMQEVWSHCLTFHEGRPDPLYEKHLSQPDKEFVPSENVVILLTSKLTASCGDAFVDLAHNIENTLIVGENTNGILTSGLGKWTLPNTGIYVTFGSDFFLHPAGEHFEEFRGYYPDIWVPAAEAEEAVMNFIAQNTMAAE